MSDEEIDTIVASAILKIQQSWRWLDQANEIAFERWRWHDSHVGELDVD